MKSPTAAGLMLVALAVTACGGRRAVEIDPNMQSAQNRWNGTVASPAELAGVSAIRGSGWMGPDQDDANQTQAHVSISNAVPGGQHPWHIHRGRCGSDQGIFGPADAYDLLEVGGDGRANSTAELPVPSPRTGQFFINIHASQKNMATIIACGNLAPPAR